jgi:hypothetical protein
MPIRSPTLIDRFFPGRATNFKFGRFAPSLSHIEFGVSNQRAPGRGRNDRPEFLAPNEFSAR